MADILSAGSSQKFLATLVDLNNMPVAASAIHAEGYFYTSANSVFKFEVNKGATKGCTIINDMLFFSLEPKLLPGNIRVRTVVHTGADTDTLGLTDAENDQLLDVSIVKSGTYVGARQGPIGVIIKLNTLITDKDQLPWSLPGNSVQAIKDEMMKVMKSPEFVQMLEQKGVADNALANVADADFLEKGKKAGLMQNNMADVELDKLQEKGNAAGLAYKDMSNIPLNIFNNFVRQSEAYQKLANMPHPATEGKTDEQIKALFFANRHEEQDAVDLTKAPYNASTTVMMAYQMPDGKSILQSLPSLARNQIVWIELIRQPDAKNYNITVSAAQGEQIDGAGTPVTLDQDTPEGMFIPVQNESTWEFVPYHRYAKSNISGYDDFGTVIQAIDKMYFKRPLKLNWNADNKEVELSVEGDLGMTFVDTILQKNFKAALGQSMDGSINIKPILIGKDDTGKDVYRVDFSVAKTASQEGVARVAEYTQIINLDYPDNQPKFSNVLYHGGANVHINNQSDSIVVQEIDGKDPNLTGGTLFLAILDYSTDKSQDNTLTQDGTIRLALTDKDGNYIQTLNGGSAVVQRTYKAGDEVKDMRLAVLFRATVYTEVFYKIEGDFVGDEAISVGLGSGMCVQAIESDSGMGDALMAYEVYTGSHVEIGKINYSTNNINFARTLVKDGVPQIVADSTSNLGNNLFLDFRTSMSTQIINNSLRVEANNPPCVFSLYQIYTYVDLLRLAGRTIDMSVDLMNKDSAMRLVMLGYNADPATMTSPKLLSFNNGQPEYNAGWIEIDSLFIAENALSDRHKETKTFAFPSYNDYKACAFILRPENGAVPVNVTIFDFEGDIKPGFTYAEVKSHFTGEQMTLLKKDMFTKSAIMCPTEYSAYRYTINVNDTKLPVGVFKDNGFVKNNNAWYDAGSIGKGDQGDIEILKSFRGSLSYSLNIFNEQATDSNVTIWLARVEKDGTFTKIADSELVVSIKANTTPSTINEVTKSAFAHNFKKGESYRLFAKADKADGAYIQCNNGSHIPMAEIVIDAEYYTEIPEDVLRANSLVKVRLMDGKNEVADPENYTVEIDVKTSAVKIVKK